ncbi:E3 ubiquitin-protein ligase XIAP-like isoform X2 [Ostrea edulis]|uniref:E3 ubiquitin-protein ligase XIAP-like isoform X2 n=1 Tax=Ostrea edulis TaxID=37623 RepID=UPI0024AFA052|nr:E3 ubiquitin-protein ligase XIAP-like isoform X2 [Ostrea edulis]
MLVLLFPVLILIVILAIFCEQIRKSQFGKYIRRSHEMKNHVISLLSPGFHLQNGIQLHSNHISVYPTSEQPNTLDTYFSACIDSGNVVNEMRYEWLRLRSFSTFPLSFPISLSPIRLARSGFYFTGRNQECVCFSCGIHNSNWTGNNVTEIHRQLSPNCRHLQGRHDTNIPIGSRESYQSHELHSETNSCTGNNEHNSCRGNNEHVSDAQQSHDINSPNRTNHQNHTAPNSQTNGFNDTLEPLGVVIDRPRYPNYSVLATRISSYQQWPSHLTQTPRDLSTAGFFYVGYNDNVRCFFCGGGLRNWESGDDAWVEHARWFPKCPFSIQNRGQDFVTLVQSVQEEESEDIPPQEQTEHVRDIEQLPAAREIRHMGYTWGTIREAYQHLNRNRADVSTAEVIEEILAGDIPASSSEPVVNDNQDIPPVTSVDPSFHNRNENNAADNFLATEMMDELGAMRLSDEIRSLREENRKLREERLCRICMEEDIAIAFLPCGHLCCCTHCAPAMRKCPICRASINVAVKTFPA